MALREALGPDVHVLRQQIEELLDGEDALVVLIGRNRFDRARSSQHNTTPE